MSNFDKFDRMVDTAGLMEDIKKAAGGSKIDYKEVPFGTYEVKIERLTLIEAKKSGLPMVSIWFKVVDGAYKNSLIFYNCTVMGTRNDSLMIHQNNELLRRLHSGRDIEFESYTQYAQLLNDVYNAIDGKYEYALKYGENAQGFKTYEIKDVYET